MTHLPHGGGRAAILGGGPKGTRVVTPAAVPPSAFAAAPPLIVHSPTRAAPPPIVGSPRRAATASLPEAASSAIGEISLSEPRSLLQKFRLFWGFASRDAEYRRCYAHVVGSYVGAGIMQGTITGIMLALATGSAALATEGWALQALLEMWTMVGGQLLQSNARDNALNTAAAIDEAGSGQRRRLRRGERRRWLRALRISGGIDLAAGVGLAGCASMVGSGIIAGSTAVGVLALARAAMLGNRFYQSAAWHSLEPVIGPPDIARNRRGISVTIASIEGAICLAAQSLVSYGAYRGVVWGAAWLGLPCLSVCIVGALTGAAVCGAFKIALPLRP